MPAAEISETSEISESEYERLEAAIALLAAAVERFDSSVERLGSTMDSCYASTTAAISKLHLPVSSTYMPTPTVHSAPPTQLSKPSPSLHGTPSPSPLLVPLCKPIPRQPLQPQNQQRTTMLPFAQEAQPPPQLSLPITQNSYRKIQPPPPHASNPTHPHRHIDPHSYTLPTTPTPIPRRPLSR
ncbi:hypothetical protein Salat_1192900 [Sesamum alatum]|uniref:Uncharacterized protein n=1 Tax=Sesamum alatum TaxID=300844 RepID=A0AAE2CP16_9LAMI|nr:hypothetical protein Salat_1192900 [Sesamum alatum]